MAAQLTKTLVDIGLVTTRIDEALAFYRDLLGFSPVLVLPRDTGDIHVLAAGEALVKLWDSPDAPEGPRGDIGAATGYRYLTIWVENQDEIVHAAREAGCEVIADAHEVAPGTLAALIGDPDGNVVEVLQEA